MTGVLQDVRYALTSLAGTVRALVRSIRPDQPIDIMQTMNDALFQALAPRRLSLVLLGSFAGLALLLSAIGIFGVWCADGFGCAAAGCAAAGP
jgi:hypothetical protein